MALKKRALHLIQICDDAYATIQRVYETLGLLSEATNKEELSAKIKIYEILNELQKNGGELMQKFNNISNEVSLLHQHRETEIDSRFKQKLDQDLLPQYSIDQSAFVATINQAAAYLKNMATNIQYNAQRKANAAVIEQKRQSLDKLTTQIAALNVTKPTALDDAKTQLTSKLEDLDEKQEYFTKASPLKKKG